MNRVIYQWKVTGLNVDFVIFENNVTGSEPNPVIFYIFIVFSISLRKLRSRCVPDAFTLLLLLFLYIN
jgi:hypothetical protein